MGIHPVVAALCGAKLPASITIKARQLARLQSLRYMGEEGIRQHLVERVLGKVDRYDPSRGAVTTFIKQIVNSEAKMLIRDHDTQKRNPSTPLLSLDQPTTHRESGTLGDAIAGSRTLEPADLASLKHRLIRDAEASMPDELQPMLRCLKRELSVSAAAAELGISRRQASQICEQLLAHFALHIEPD